MAMAGELCGLTVMQPWASLLASGAKQFETRGWRTNYRGWVLLHASRTLPPEGAAVWAECGQRLPGGDRRLQDLPRGAVVGAARLVACVPTERVRMHLTPTEAALGDFSPGRWAWRFIDPLTLAEPIPWRGMQGLWPAPDELLRLVARAQFPPAGVRTGAGAGVEATG